jgi:hypothetical protein
MVETRIREEVDDDDEEQLTLPSHQRMIQTYRIFLMKSSNLPTDNSNLFEFLVEVNTFVSNSALSFSIQHFRFQVSTFQFSTFSWPGVLDIRCKLAGNLYRE